MYYLGNSYVLILINITASVIGIKAILRIQKDCFLKNNLFYPSLFVSIFLWAFTAILLIIKSFNTRFQLLGLNIISLYEYIAVRPKWIVETIIIIIFLSLLLRGIHKLLFSLILGKEGRKENLSFIGFLISKYKWMEYILIYNKELHHKIFFNITKGKWSANLWTLIFHIPFSILIIALLFDIRYNEGYLFFTIIGISIFFAFGFIGDIHFKLLLYAPLNLGEEDWNHGNAMPDPKPKHREILGPPMRTNTRFGFSLKNGFQYSKSTENIYQPAVKAWTRATYAKAGVSVAATFCFGCVLVDSYLCKREKEMIEGEYRILEVKYGESITEMRGNHNSPGHNRVKMLDKWDKERGEINEKSIGPRLIHNGGHFINGYPKENKIAPNN